MTSYGRADLIGEATNADIDNSEEDILVITDLGKLTNSQLCHFITYSLGTNTSLSLRFYVLGEIGGTWHVLPRINEADGTLDPGTVVIDASTPASPLVYEMPLPACYGFKVTGQGTGGANSSITVRTLARDN